MTWREVDGKRATHGPRRHYLPLDFAQWNLLEHVRQQALATFSRNDIKWHASSDAPGAGEWPSSHLLDSQVQCVNVFLSLVHARTGILKWARGGELCPSATGLIPIEDGVPVAFEWSGSGANPDFLGELRGRPARRGELRTSIDAFVVAETPDGRTALLIEWKFTEHDSNSPDEGRNRKRIETYGPLLAAPGSCFTAGATVEPFLENRAVYQLLRLHLLAAEFVRSRDLGITRAVVVQVTPKTNRWERQLVPPQFAHLGATLNEAWPKLLRVDSPVRSAFLNSDEMIEMSPALQERYGDTVS